MVVPHSAHWISFNTRQKRRRNNSSGRRCSSSESEFLLVLPHLKQQSVIHKLPSHSRPWETTSLEKNPIGISVFPIPGLKMFDAYTVDCIVPLTSGLRINNIADVRYKWSSHRQRAPLPPPRRTGLFVVPYHCRTRRRHDFTLYHSN